MATEVSNIQSCMAAMNAGFSAGVLVGLVVGVVVVWAYDRWVNR